VRTIRRETAPWLQGQRPEFPAFFQASGRSDSPAPFPNTLPRRQEPIAYARAARDTLAPTLPTETGTTGVTPAVQHLAQRCQRHGRIPEKLSPVNSPQHHHARVSQWKAVTTPTQCTHQIDLQLANLVDLDVTSSACPHRGDGISDSSFRREHHHSAGAKLPPRGHRDRAVPAMLHRNFADFFQVRVFPFRSGLSYELNSDFWLRPQVTCFKEFERGSCGSDTLVRPVSGRRATAKRSRLVNQTAPDRSSDPHTSSTLTAYCAPLPSPRAQNRQGRYMLRANVPVH